MTDRTHREHPTEAGPLWRYLLGDDEHLCPRFLRWVVCALAAPVACLLAALFVEDTVFAWCSGLVIVGVLTSVLASEIAASGIFGGGE